MRKKLSAPKPPTADLWNIERDGVTQGFLETLLTCPEKARYKYREGLEPVRYKGAIAFGNIVHDCLEHVYTTFRDTGDSLLATASVEGILSAHEFMARQALQEEGRLSAVEEELEELYGMAEALLAHYWQRWESDFDGTMQWESLEEKFSIPYVIDGVTIPVRGKLDGRYRRGSRRRLWVVDHKSKGEINENAIANRLALDLQSMLYLWAVRQLTGEIPAGMIYNVMRRPQLRRKKAETIQEFCSRIYHDIEERTDFYYVRFEAAFDPSDFELWEKEFHHMMKQALSWSRGEYHYRFSPACESKYGTCEYLGLCGPLKEMSGLRRREDVYPELVQIEKE